MLIPQIITIDVKKFFEYYPREDKTKSFCFNTVNRYYYHMVVKQLDDFDECPLFHQIINSETFEKEEIDTDASDEWLLDKLIILDFGTIFRGTENYNMSSDKMDKTSQDEADKSQRDKRNETLQKNVKELFEKGLDIAFYDGKKVHMLSFDKSGNMSRHSRITFINENYYDELNERLNLGINFSEIEVSLSKYYAYRGLYLTSSKHVQDNEIEITPETLVILKDKTKKQGLAYERNIPIVSATSENGVNWEFTKEENAQLE